MKLLVDCALQVLQRGWIWALACDSYSLTTLVSGITERLGSDIMMLIHGCKPQLEGADQCFAGI
jgi:hypothetical protein